MKRLDLATLRPACGILALLLALLLSGCQFRKGYQAKKQGEIPEAERLLAKAEKQGTLRPGPAYHLADLRKSRARSMAEFQDLHQQLCAMEEEFKDLPERRQRKLFRYEVTPGNIAKTRAQLERRLLKRLCTTGTVAALDTLYAGFPCWTPENELARDSVRNIIVNRTIDPKRAVYPDMSDCREWQGGATPPPIEQILAEPDRPCASIALRDSWQISYEEATTIAQRYADVVIKENYPKFWDIMDGIWDIFLIHHSFCEMDRFRADHPTDFIALDCWYDEARDTLCLGRLRPLLAFHRHNPHTALDIAICNQILCLAQTAEDAGSLNAEEQQQVEDVRMMLNLQRQLIYCEPHYDPAELSSKVVYLAEKYPHHRAVFDLAMALLNHLVAEKGQLAEARAALEVLPPLFPDAEACPARYYFQVDKQAWFARFAAQLQGLPDSIALPEPMLDWNTPDHDEYSLVSWGGSEEVFFVRRKRETGQAQIMTSRLMGDAWTKPAPVPELSVAEDMVPLSISFEGRYMLLQAEGQLLQSQRLAPGRRWSRPSPLPLPFEATGKGMLTPDGDLLLLEAYPAPASLVNRPKKDLYLARLGKNDRFEAPVPLSEKINLPGSHEATPLLALNGRLLFYASDRTDGLGKADLFSAELAQANDWASTQEPLSLGMPFNTVFEDYGITHFSEYSNHAYFHRFDHCTGDLDIWRLPIPSASFPPGAMRLAGLVLDENLQPLNGGFMEFTTDYNLHVHAQGIAANGTYTYTPPNETEVVRLFPEIPGYYSEHDAVHFLADVPKGEIIRDTFILLSFEHIRQHFKLRHSTFINGTARFDLPEQAFPELTRLAKIAVRMGAELDLVGHTDSTGAEGANQQLALDRAQSVKSFLVEKCGFPASKIRVFGFGPTRPLCPNDSEEGRRCNRRVEVAFRMPDLPSIRKDLPSQDPQRE
jgi:hypothetical protein